MQLNKPNTLRYLNPTNKEFYYKSKKDQDANFALLPKHLEQYERSQENELSTLVLYWAFKYVVLSNLGRNMFQSIFRNPTSYIWSETIQTKSFTTKFECQANSRDRARLKIIKVYNRSKVCKKAKIKSKVRANGLKNKNKYRTCRWTKITTKIKTKVVKITSKIRWRGRVKFEIRPKNIIKRKWGGDWSYKQDLQWKV